MGIRAPLPPAATSSLWLAGVMALAVLALQCVPVLAPAIAAEHGLSSGFVGLYNGAVWAAAIPGTLLAPWGIARWGAWRVTQACLAACALGLLATLGAGLLPPGLALLLGALLIGLGQGLEAPAATQVLVRYVPAASRPLWFSVKQSGVQAGAFAASLALPLIATAAGWRWAAGVAAMLVVAGLAALARPRRTLAVPPDAASASTGAAPALGAVALLRASPPLAWLALAAAMFGAVQLTLNGFFVTLAVQARGATLVEAGAWLGAAQAGGWVGRLGWGWIASRHVAPLRLLSALALVMAACAAAVGLGIARLPAAALWPLVVVYGLSASGWNGVFLAEVARRGPPEAAGRATAAVLVVMTCGLVGGPLIVAALAAAIGWGPAVASTAGAALIGAAALRRAA